MTVCVMCTSVLLQLVCNCLLLMPLLLLLLLLLLQINFEALLADGRLMSPNLWTSKDG